MMEKILFKEEQRFSRWWIWLILLASFVIAVVPLWYGLYVQISTGEPWGNEPASDGELAFSAALVTVLMAGILVLFILMRLQVEVRIDGVHFRFLPVMLRWRVISKAEIEHFEIGKYKPIAQYGGWGIRLGFPKNGRAYNVAGNIGMKLFLKNKKIILLGTQRSQALSYAMEKLMSENKVSY
jgi:hypothetical protein